jgi:hypothetical protein
MSLANPLAWVLTSYWGKMDDQFYETRPRFAKPTDIDGLWNPTGGDGDGAFVGPVHDELWLSWAGGYAPQMFYRNEGSETPSGTWSIGDDVDNLAFPQYGNWSFDADNTPPYSGEITGSVDDQAIPNGLWVGPILPGSFRIHDFNNITLQDDGDGNIECLVGSSPSGSGTIDYETGEISFSFTSSSWGTDAGQLMLEGMLYTRPTVYGSGPSLGQAVAAPDPLPSSVVINWRRLNTPAEGVPITLRYFALTAAPEGVVTGFDYDLDPTEVEIPDSADAEEGSYELAIPEGTTIFALQLHGEAGCLGETDIEFWFTEVEVDDCDVCFDVGHLCTSPIADLVPDVLEHVPKASDPQVEAVLKDVVIDFLKRTKLLHFDHPAISLVADQADYTLQNPCGFQILHVRSATIDGSPIIQTSEEQLDLEWQELSKGFGWRYQFSEVPTNCPVEDWRRAESDLPGLFYQLNPNQLTLVGIPTTAIADALALKVVVIPTRAVENIPRWIFNTWHQGIVAGAIGNLKMMPEKPWSDRQAAGAYLDAYNEAVGAAEGSGLRGFKRNDQPLLRTKIWN